MWRRDVVEAKLNLAALWYHEGVGDRDVQEVSVCRHVGRYCAREGGCLWCGVRDEGRGEGGGRVGGHGEVEEGIAPCKELLGHSEGGDVGAN